MTSSGKKRTSTSGPESAANLDVTSPLQEDKSAAAKVKVKADERGNSDLEAFRKQEEDRFVRMNRALVVQQVAKDERSAEGRLVNRNIEALEETINEELEEANAATQEAPEQPALAASSTDTSAVPANASTENPDNGPAVTFDTTTPDNEQQSPKTTTQPQQSADDAVNNVEDEEELLKQEAKELEAKQLEKSQALLQELRPFGQILRGGNADVIQQRSRVVRIFLSSTFSGI